MADRPYLKQIHKHREAIASETKRSEINGYNSA